MAGLKKAITAEISRGIATSLPYSDIARNISNASAAPLARANTIARTEGHRIQQTSTVDAQNTAKSKGADVVKQWDAALDGRTRDSHRMVDGEIRELDKPFSNGLMFPGDPSGSAAEVVNCRCVSNTRAKWALDDSELQTLKDRAEFFGLDKTKNFDDYKENYQKATQTLQKKAKSGIMDIEIDEFTPCLRDTKTGEIIKTEVAQITDKSLLNDYSEKTGWNVDWAKTPKDVDVYALHIQGQDEIQGLIGIRNDRNMQAAYVHWASTAPRNNKKLRNGEQDYAGVGGHLFAIAAEKSVDMGYDGFMYGFASNAKVEAHYIEKFGADHLGQLHPFQFVIDERSARKLLERYNYEWKK